VLLMSCLKLREFIDSSQNSEKDSIESSGGKSGEEANEEDISDIIYRYKNRTD